ncbi:MAG: hypothetical protein COU82_02085 [Candidatus Portnoybacteria bacterium CG10_big_fil_rev_8_21_14_0_10_38_18]|uniref:Protein kinase domain-containing protein n=1 Tax=Candidatus Portnoybacteria bacterium CG10_big_fil_rev_8_21_14_0_10_38_18 TaxID=1974813 RepID=A0A2M8KBY1_9BACT|nr:MAG: hypothetical protein COU82_02085 [Candidatus Portnoybacteria bacterium CG10_big_fil_rev_8_21_14_0_10_38_18]
MVREKIDRYFHRAKSAAEQVLIDDKKKPHNLDKKELWGKMWSSQSKYERLTSFLGLVKDSLPRNLFNFDKDKLKDIFYHQEELPFNPEKYKFEEKIGIGGQSRVYLLESQTKENPSMVLKIAVPDKEEKSPLEQVEAFEQEYKYIRRGEINCFGSACSSINFRSG